MAEPFASPAQLVAPTAEQLRQAATLLLRGELVAMPTETVYGLAGNAFDPEAVARIFAVKERPRFDPLIVHVGAQVQSLDDLDRMGVVDVAQMGPAARRRASGLIEAFWPGPLTLVLPRGRHIGDLVTSGLPSVAVRQPRHPVAAALLEAVGVPLAAPSANRFGRISPTSAVDVMHELGERIPLILDGGSAAIGLESTVVAVTEAGELRLLRPGGVPTEQIEAESGCTLLTATREAAATSPGQLLSHYAPRKRLRLLPTAISALTAASLTALARSLQLPERQPWGFLAHRGQPEALAEQLTALGGRPAVVRVLSPTGELSEAARNLFAALRALDASEADPLWAEPWSVESGLGFAIADRLRRAAHEV